MSSESEFVSLGGGEGGRSSHFLQHNLPHTPVKKLKHTSTHNAQFPSSWLAAAACFDNCCCFHSKLTSLSLVPDFPVVALRSAYLMPFPQGKYLLIFSTEEPQSATKEGGRRASKGHALTHPLTHSLEKPVISIVVSTQ